MTISSTIRCPHCEASLILKETLSGMSSKLVISCKDLCGYQCILYSYKKVAEKKACEIDLLFPLAVSCSGNNYMSG